ncbi:bifunctional DNA primase/polymerase [Methylocystis sp. ATCC 49242]|uniref:bifunctional DNA primase/polymerase n=1 Tax=Methylocystis sp. ATCC 49242 TaxID=622637 RepID=UPI00055F3D02|nr:bifunctional DNA primase/polymerase [Methylocystis sp. ATCC 49242]
MTFLGIPFDPAEHPPRLHNDVAAHELAAAGLHVHPCDATKRPLTKWSESSSIDAARIDDWWTRWPDALPAIDLASAGLLVIDADRHGGPDGVAAFDQLVAVHGLPDGAPVIETARGGLHYIFRNLPDQLGNREGGLAGRGINVRGAGGYIIAPGSILPDGRCWREADGSPTLVEAYSSGTIPEVPAWIVALIRDKPARPEPSPSPSRPPGSREEAYARAAIDDEAAKVAGAAEGGRNNTLNAAAFAAGQMVAAGWISREECASVLLAAAATCGLSRGEAMATFGSGFNAGLKQPRGALEDREPPAIMYDPKPRATIVENGVVADAETGEILRQPAGESGRIGRLGILTSAQFVAGFTPPDYFLDGVCQRGFLYSLTAATGAGKTAVALTIAATAGGGGGTLGGREVMGGKVLFLAGENPDDARMRWIAMAHHFDFDIATIGVRFRPTAFDISKSLPDLRAEAEAAGEFSLIICDTSAAFFQGDDENSNTQLGAYARTQLRKLTELPGRPCVIVLCHPTKNASADNLLPRGGGAFLAEVDGNLTASNTSGIVTMHWQGKFRGPDFEPLRFALEKVSTPSLVDSRGREIPSVIARPLDMREAGALAADERREEDILLELMLDHEAASIAELARLAGWTTGDTPHKSKVARILQSFAAERPPLAKKIRAHWTLTGNGQEEAARVRDERRKAEQTAARFSRLGEPE